MFKNIGQNIKQDISSRYFAASIMIVLGVCLLSPGIGALDYNYINRPMLIEELLLHNKMEFSNYGDTYNYKDIFVQGISGLFYTILPLLSMASVNRYCEERLSGYWVQKTVKIGQRSSTISNLIAAAVSSVFSVILGLLLFMAFIMFRLPYQKFEASMFLSYVFYICCLSVLGAILSILVAAITKDKFYSFIIPLLLFYSEDEFLSGSIYYNFSIRALMNPANKTVSFCFIVIMVLLLGLLVDRVEKGRWGIDV